MIIIYIAQHKLRKMIISLLVSFLSDEFLTTPLIYYHPITELPCFGPKFLSSQSSLDSVRKTIFKRRLKIVFEPVGQKTIFKRRLKIVFRTLNKTQVKKT